jgi:RNA polymerase sigma-70 factor (ECF subfamily)
VPDRKLAFAIQTASHGILATMTRADDGSDSALQIPRAPSDEFVQLFTKWQRRLFLFILAQSPNPVEAEEILQETNLVIWRKSHTFSEGTNFYAWCCRIAVLEVLKSRERRRRRTALLSDTFVEAIAREAEESVDSLEDRRRALLACLQRLAPADRDLVRRRYAPGASGKTVAGQLGRPANSVYQSLSRIRRMLLECIKRRLAAEAQA